MLLHDNTVSEAAMTQRPAEAPLARPAPSPRLLKVRKLIEREHAAPLTAGRMARHVGMRVSDLNNQFLASYGITPDVFLVDCRMRAATLLLQRKISEVNVALLVGYSSHRRYLIERRSWQRRQLLLAGEAAYQSAITAD